MFFLPEPHWNLSENFTVKHLIKAIYSEMKILKISRNITIDKNWETRYNSEITLKAEMS